MGNLLPTRLFRLPETFSNHHFTPPCRAVWWAGKLTLRHFCILSGSLNDKPKALSKTNCPADKAGQNHCSLLIAHCSNCFLLPNSTARLRRSFGCLMNLWVFGL
ncbi:MAG: hypothetical protein IKZ88_10075 [Neisseriaceae bacterium]|nr:hypothetical protein [Neisseriaceae bacterium]